MLNIRINNPWENKRKTGDFFSHNYFCVWRSNNKEKSWRHIYIDFGLRRSELFQLCPIWFMGNNCQKSIMFGFWKVYFEVGYKY